MRAAVWFLLEVGDGKAELFDCATCTRPETHCDVCPIEDQPTQLEAASWYLKLYSRVKRYGVLPESGGILDQDEPTMECLDLVDETVGRYLDLKRKLETGKHGGDR